jgi:TonB family protein
MKTLLCLLSCAWFAGLAQVPAADKPPTYVDPVLIYKPKTDYTPEAEAAKLQGTVYLYVEVSPEGKAENVQVMHGLGLGLDEKAVESVRQWRFKPGTKDGQPERVAQSVEIGFRLPDGGPWLVRQNAFAVAAKRRDVLAKPVLTSYASPDPAACPAEGGATTVELSIGENGRPHSIKAWRPGDPISAAAAKAIESWRFQPGTVNGKPRGSKELVEFECAPPPAPARDQKVYAVGDGVSAPVPIYQPEPRYTREALDWEFQGEMSLQMVIDSTGHPRLLRIIKMAGLGLDEKALETVALWRFKPAMKEGKPVSVRAEVSTRFQLL